MRERLKAAQSKTNDSSSKPKSGASELFRHWDMPFDTTTTIRFLPDADNSNQFFWRERQMITLSFDSVEGHPEMRPEDITIQVPCVRMYDHKNTCPILSKTKSWWKTDKEDLARKYWPKKSYLYQGFVIDSEVDEEAPETPIRRFIISKSIHQIIENGLMDEDMLNDPTDFQNGTDFRIRKVNGSSGFADYKGSGFARKETSLTDEQIQALEDYDLYDLKTFLPNEPNAEQLLMIEEMFEESLRPNSQFKLKWASYLKPFKLELTDAEKEMYIEGNGTPPPAAVTSESADSATSDVPWNEQSDNAPTSTEDAMAKLRARMAKSAG